jgi:hypothetical protein
MQAFIVASIAALLILAYAVPRRAGAVSSSVTARQNKVVPEPDADFGDAPDSYGTMRASDGARHVAAGPILGTKRAAEPDAPIPLDGKADDNDDGVASSMLQPGATATLNINASVGSILNAWIDFDSNGTFTASEQVAKNHVLTAGGNSLSVNLPDTAPPGIHYARFRLTSAPVKSPLPTGLLPDGEVEDYALMFRPALGYLVAPR